MSTLRFPRIEKITGPISSEPLEVYYPPEGCGGGSSCPACRAEGLVFLCKRCFKLQPWCFGTADKYFEYCDDCAEHLRHNNSPYIHVKKGLLEDA